LPLIALTRSSHFSCSPKHYLFIHLFTSNKPFSQWNEVFADMTIASAILDRVLHHCTVINIKGESYRLKERKEYMKQKQHIVNALFVQED